MFSAMNTRFDQLVVSEGNDHDEHSVNLNGRSEGGGPTHTFAPKLAKLDFPRFNVSDDPTSWIY